MNGDGPTSGTRRPPEGGPSLLDRALAAYHAALPAPPPPPSIDHVWAAIESAPARRRGFFVPAAVAASLLVAAGAVALWATHGGDAGSPPSGAASIRVLDPSAVRTLRDGKPVEARSPRLGDRIEAARAVTVSVGDRVRVELDAGASLELVAENGVRQTAGRVRYDVVHQEGSPFVVTTASLAVRDVGTTFSVDVIGRAPALTHDTERVLVCVESGSVDATDTRRIGTLVPSSTVTAGTGLEFVAGKAAGTPWPLDAKPSLSLGVDSPSPVAGSPTDFRVTLTNPTDGWIPLPVQDPARNPLWIEIRGADGAVRPIRVAERRFVVEAGQPDGWAADRAIPPRGRATVRVRLDHAFASPGTYRLRAVYRVTDAIESPASPEITVTVR